MYISSIIEQYIFKNWEETKIFSYKLFQGKIFAIILPPPNITGNLHLGHSFQYIIMDIIIRFNRLLSINVLWQPGFDHAGIATQIVVQKVLKLQNKDFIYSNKLLFVRAIWRWKKNLICSLKIQFFKLGTSIDWALERFTMDFLASKSVCFSFLKLFYSNLIYRGYRLINWDFILQTAISDLELFYQTENIYLWYIKYFCNFFFFLEISTTRLETILIDSAVIINPRDNRYIKFKDLIISSVFLNIQMSLFFSFEIDLFFGSGCMKLTPAHDFLDYKINITYKLPMNSIFTTKQNINYCVSLGFQGFSFFFLKKWLTFILIKKNIITRQKIYFTKISKGDRSESIVEPMLTFQWFLKIKLLRNTFFYLFFKTFFKFYPVSWKNVYSSWFSVLEDWCLSRQLLWGHSINIFYNNTWCYMYPCTHVYYLLIYIKNNIFLLCKEQDVFDTWFSSSLWPLISLNIFFSNKFRKYYPTNLLITGFDIIFFWVIRMILLCFFFTNVNSFKNILITGLFRDSFGNKMSKSKNNIIDPIKIINLESEINNTSININHSQTNRYGIDSLRFYLTYLVSESRKLFFNFKTLLGFRNYCNKLWNIYRFFFIIFKNFVYYTFLFFSLVDILIFFNLTLLIKKYILFVAEYRFTLLTNILYHFIKFDFAIYYIEFIKLIINSCYILERQYNVKFFMFIILHSIFCLLNPIIPFLTEKIYYKYNKIYFKLLYTSSLSVFRFPFYKGATINKLLQNLFFFLSEFPVFFRFILQKNLHYINKKILYFYFLKIKKNYIVLFYEFEFFFKKILKIKFIFFNKINYVKFFNFQNIILTLFCDYKTNDLSLHDLTILKEKMYYLSLSIFDIRCLLKAPLVLITKINKQIKVFLQKKNEFFYCFMYNL